MGDKNDKQSKVNNSVTLSELAQGSKSRSQPRSRHAKVVRRRDAGYIT